MEIEFELSEAERASMAASEAAHIEHERAEEQQRQSVLIEVHRVASTEMYLEILSELSDSSYTFDFQIAASPMGREQDEGAAWGSTFVNQTTDGGVLGDEFSGTVSIPLGDGRFFQYGYAM